MQITYQDGGPSYYVNDYFPHLHFQAAASLADENYDHLVEWSSENVHLDDLAGGSNAVDTLVEEGAIDSILELDLD